MFEQVGEESGLGCFQTVNLEGEAANKFVAECRGDGTAEVALFVRASAFSGLDDIAASVPGICKTGDQYDAASGQTAMFVFNLPCRHDDGGRRLRFCLNVEGVAPR